MSSIQSNANASTQGTAAAASATASAPQKPVVLVPGEQADSVTVQSQLATSTVAGDVQHHSNLSQVATDLLGARNAHSSWVDSESAKITVWGQGEIARILAQTKGIEETLVTQAKQKQVVLDNEHKAELAKLVQKLDLQKAAQLKELEDGLQRQIQAALTTSKNEINRIETDMNNKKMDLLKQAQLKQAKDIDALSNLVVETKLVPSTTRTVIETATNTGSVIAIATGGEISTGQATAQAISSQRIAAVPNAGMLQQATDVKTGDMVKNATGEKVGEGAIVSTQTNVVEQPASTTAPLAAPATTTAAPVVQHRHPASGVSLNSGVRPAGDNLAADRDLHHGATQRPGEHVPIDAGRQAGSTINAPGGVQLHDGQAAAYDKTKELPRDTTHDKETRRVDAAYGKHDTHQSGGLLGKVRNALTHASEPKSSDATKRV